jgi:ATP-dependent helicase HrpA
MSGSSSAPSRSSLDDLLATALVADRLSVQGEAERWRFHENPGATARKMHRWRERLQKSSAKAEQRARHVPHADFPPELPISSRAEEIIATIRDHQVVVIAGETGSGKTTQLPKMCLAAGLGVRGKIACTQPRRVAALSVSRRIAEELKVPWGREVGAKIRFTDKTGDDTYIKMMTDGMLLAEVQGDPLMSEYEAVIIDEAHERSLNIDFLLGYLHGLRAKRPDLKILITSATIDTEAFSKAFDDAPIIEVSGRTYPVDVLYAPLDELLEESGDFTAVDGVGKAVENVITDNRPGDILVFLPGERDIRDARDLLEGMRLGRVEILPLFGRLSNAEQQRIFAPTQARKIILATNIAETSLTIPGIRYVIDVGLARISRYHAATHTRRLPIEPVSQSSADQRKGRAGRVSDGLCIRLYSEQDYNGRPRYSTPEILRSNLAEVILKMIAFRLGRIEDFPFLNPPTPAAVRADYSLLQDLGALDEERTITALGRELARLPCDPTVGRMLLEARRENCVREVLVIASALSIQDPRERPAEASEEADRMHRQFLHPESDFLTLLNIWDRYHDELDRLTQKQLRKFCKSHFLSYLRMREWREVHQQLLRVLEELGDVKVNTGAAEYFQVHRALLAGLLSNVAQRDQGNHYKATHQRQVMLFPGSGLFDKQAAKAERKMFKGKQKPAKESGKRTPPWIVCAEWMETSRLFARTNAGIEVEWILGLAGHVLKSSYSEPYYEETSERVLVRERRHLYGLEVQVRRVPYVRLNGPDSTEIFIRSALVGGTLKTGPAWYEANQELRAAIEDKQTRLRHASAWQLDERVYQFYADKLAGAAIGSIPDLNRWLKEKHGGRDAVLRMSEDDLLGGNALDVEAYPEQVEIEGVTLDLAYTYKPGEEADGATLRIPVSAFAKVDAAHLDWAVPGFIRERIDCLLRGLPKETRRKLHPLAEKSEILAEAVRPKEGRLEDQLTRLIAERYGLRIWPDEWSGKSVPDYLRTRVEIIDDEAQVVGSGRDWEAVRSALEASMRGRGDGDSDDERRRQRNAVWAKSRSQFERRNLTSWDFGTLEEERTIGQVAGLPVMAFPGLSCRDEHSVDLRLFPSTEAAREATPPAYRRLLEQVVGKDLGWLEKELARELKRVKLVTTGWIPFPALQRQAWQCARRSILGSGRVPPVTAETFATDARTASQATRGWAPRFVDRLEDLCAQRRRIRSIEDVNSAREATFARLLPPDFLTRIGAERLEDYPRYLTALEKRLGRARLDPTKDLAKARLIVPYERALGELKKATAEREALFWALEEFRVQTFAQVLGTRGKISPKILDRLLAEARQREALPGAAPVAEAVLTGTEKPPESPSFKKQSTAAKTPQSARKLDQEDLLDLKSALEKKLGF